ncbi:MAG: 3-methyl-2-oxobutanoate hydroxymethyltransferase, partial [Planctomycetaceae bacterium]|nr:3-methyl-2-oxobutanoate hydroxymethyltransferase [Planctomycetaceae bacterium]
MQDQNERPRSLTIHDLVQAKQDDRPISMVTAYDWWSGCLVDSAGVDCVLVGDSLAMVIAGKPTTLSATIEQM